MTSARGISFEIRPSALLTAWLIVLVCLATLAPIFTSLPFVVRCPAAAIIGVFGIQRVHAYRQPRLRLLHWAVDGSWSVTDRRGVAVPAELLAARRVGLAMFLAFRWRDGAGHVALLPDNAHPDDLRRLRGCLKPV